MSAIIDATPLPRANWFRITDRRASTSSTMARHPPNQAAVVTASNMLEFGQRPETYQRSSSANVCRAKAKPNALNPSRRASVQRYTTDITSNTTLSR